jgi:hypothetical protein
MIQHFKEPKRQINKITHDNSVEFYDQSSIISVTIPCLGSFGGTARNGCCFLAKKSKASAVPQPF